MKTEIYSGRSLKIYNNPNSFKVAIEFLSGLDEKKLVLMGDMVELGQDIELFHAKVGKYARTMGINEFLSIGKNSRFASKAFGHNGLHFEDKESLKSYLNNNIAPSTRILIKGSRAAKLEEYVDFLKASDFRARFEAKGRFQQYVADIPTFVITEPDHGLIGAAAYLDQNFKG